MLPKSKQALSNEYRRCEHSFVKVPREAGRAYLSEALIDLASAEKELKSGSPKWAIAKAYQALFLVSNGILVARKGFYSKDHGCVLVALLYHGLIPEEILGRIEEMLGKRHEATPRTKPDLFEEVSSLRVMRNTYLYMPSTLRRVRASERDIVEEVRLLVAMLGEAL